MHHRKQKKKNSPLNLPEDYMNSVAKLRKNALLALTLELRLTSP